MFEAGLIPTIFEAKNNIGGLWSPPQEGNVETIQLDTRMSTNSSHYSCMFSDWFPYTREELPIYPATPAIWKYLCGFAEKYLPKETVRLGCRVVSVSSDDPEGLASWTVGFEDSEGQTRSEVFEYLVVCTGNFSNGFIPHIDELRKFPGTAIHSSEYVGANIIPQDEPAGAKRKILVVGGTLSAVEIASDVALFASSLPKEHRSQIQVLHLFSQPFWILPKLLPFENPDDKTAPKVLPLDQVFFNAAAVVNAPPPTSPEAKFEQINKLLASMLGDQSNIGPEYKFNDHWNMNPMAVGMTESYDKFVRSGVIKPVVGRYTGISEEGAVRVAAAEHCELSSDQVLDGVDTIIFATGFTPWPALKKMLAPEILRRMGFEPEETDVSPHRVHRCLYKQNIHPNLGKHIGFMGLMPRPFWGAMEIQGRWLASMFSGKMPWPTPDEISDFAKGPEWLAAQGRVDDAVLLRGEGAYLDVISDLSKKMKLAPFEIAIAGDHAPKTFVPAHLPAFSPSNNGALEHSQNAISILHRVLAEDAVSPENISRAVFAELQGRWAITRTLSSKLPGFPDGDFIGTAEFHPRLPTFSSTAAAPTAAGPSCQNRTIDRKSVV